MSCSTHLGIIAVCFEGDHISTSISAWERGGPGNPSPDESATKTEHTVGAAVAHALFSSDYNASASIENIQYVEQKRRQDGLLPK